MKNKNYTHIAFSDDSNHSSGVYKSLCLVTFSELSYQNIIEEIRDILLKSGITSEFKWKKLKTAKYRFAAEKIIRFIFKHQKIIRIDNIIWNINDSRHKDIVGIDKAENLVRMYYHLFSWVTSKQWPITNTIWEWNPDHQSSVNWDILRDCIINKKHDCLRSVFNPLVDFKQVDINSINPSKSDDHPFIQVADLFAGISVYSHGEFENYSNWVKENSPQINIFNSNLKTKYSSSQKNKFYIIQVLNSLCKKYKLGVALNSTKGFKTHNQSMFLNFWLYEPQHKMDKAPTKLRS